jgi:hypothetical protein
MFDSKALKDFPEKKSSKLYLWWIDSAIGEWYYEFTHKYVTNPIFQIKRLYQWYKNVFRNDYDFDFHCMFAIIEYKLKRIQKCLENGHAIQEDQDMHALALAIKLAGRLKDDKYEERSYDRMDKKWGEMKTWTTPCNDRSGCSEWHSSRPNANTDEEKAQEMAYRREQYRLSEYRKKREERWMYAILQRHGRSWWD